MELFYELWRDGREFLELPPDSSEYAQWLTESRDEIGKYSPCSLRIGHVARPPPPRVHLLGKHSNGESSW